jgi:uncharacterized lipoprotein YbaY
VKGLAAVFALVSCTSTVEPRAPAPDVVVVAETPVMVAVGEVRSEGKL